MRSRKMMCFQITSMSLFCVQGLMYVTLCTPGDSKWSHNTLSCWDNNFMRARKLPGLPGVSKCSELPRSAMHCLPQNRTTCANDFKIALFLSMFAAFPLSISASNAAQSSVRAHLPAPWMLCGSAETGVLCTIRTFLPCPEWPGYKFALDTTVVKQSTW